MSKNNLIVYLADDHHVVRKSMSRLVNSFGRVARVEEAADGRELIKLIEQGIPDAVIMDLEMPGMGGIEAGKQIAERFPEVKILVLTMHTEGVFINRLLDVGVHGFLSKACQPDEVEKALYSIVDYDFYRNEIVVKALSNIQKTNSEPGTKLTNRELEILLLICQELRPNEISERLQISEKTFFNHRSNILIKTRSRSNVGLVQYAIHRGYYQLPGLSLG